MLNAVHCESTDARAVATFCGLRDECIYKLEVGPGNCVGYSESSVHKTMLQPLS